MTPQKISYPKVLMFSQDLRKSTSFFLYIRFLSILRAISQQRHQFEEIAETSFPDF
jgi:hypothetical protein